MMENKQKEIWELCNCTKEEWDNLSVRAKYDRKNRRGLVNKRKIDYTPSLTKVDLQQYIQDIILDKEGNVEEIILIDGKTAKIHSTDKYRAVQVNKNKCYQLHRIVYAWFIGSIPRNYVVDHIDNDKTNNKPNNLQLLTRIENVKKNYTDILNQYIKK